MTDSSEAAFLRNAPKMFKGMSYPKNPTFSEPAKRSKYRNVRTTVDGITFASKAEAKRYQELKLLERAGEIHDLELQKPYQLHATDGAKLAKYIADFDYIDKRTGTRVTEDVKGVATAAFRIKAKLFKAEIGREITIVRAR